MEWRLFMEIIKANNVVYEYECTNNKETVIQGNKVKLMKMIKNRFYLERK